MSYNKFEGIVMRTRSIASKKLNKLLAQTVQAFIEPAFTQQAALEEERVHMVLLAAALVDSRSNQWIQQIPVKAGCSLAYKLGDSESSMTIMHAPVSYRPMDFLKIDKAGNFSWSEGTHRVSKPVDEIMNVFLMYQAVAVELDEWTDQFRGNKTDKWGSKSLGNWDIDKLSQACAFSPLYRANLSMREHEAELRAYKHGPRTSDKKFMSPMLVKALTTTAHLEEVKE